LLLFAKHSNAYPDKEIPSKTAIHRLVTQFRVDACLRERGEKFQHLLYSFCVKIFYEIKAKKATRLPCYIDVAKIYK